VPAVPAWSEPVSGDEEDEVEDIVDLEAVPGWADSRPSHVPATLDEAPPQAAVAPPRPARPTAKPIPPRVPAPPTPPPPAPAPAVPQPVAQASESEAVDEAAEAAAKAAADKKTPGRPLWVWPKQIPGQPYSTAPVRCCPVLFGKTQFAACFGSKLIAFDWKNSGLEVLWEYDCVAHVPGSPVLGNDGLIRVHSSDGWLHCVDQQGAREWDPVPVGEPLGWAAPVVDADGNAYVSSYSGGLLKVTARGNFKSTPFFRTRQKFDSTGVIYQGVLYTGCEDAYVYAIELADDTGRNLWDQLDNRGKTDWFINSAPAVTADGMIVVAGRDENLYGFHRDGKLAWKVNIPGQMLSSPLVGGNGDIYIGNSILKVAQKDRGKMVCIDGSSHRVRWEYDAKGAVESIPVIGDDDVLYFGDNAGYVHALRPDGHCLWSTNVRSAVRSAGMIVGPNRLVFGTDGGTMVGILCSSGGVSRKGWAKYMAKIR
jgi:outer membrane protein assembly factor BamB